MQNLDHLHKDLHGLVELPNEQRILKLRRDQWVPYTVANQVLNDARLILKAPPHARVKGMFIEGQSANGKSRLLTKIEKLEADPRPFKSSAYLPVVRIQTPPSPSEGALYSEILTRFSIPGSGSTVAEKRKQVVTNLQTCGAKILIMDELHNMLDAGPKKYKAMLNAVRYIINEVPIALMAAGTSAAVGIVQGDIQLANRLTRIQLPVWRASHDEFSIVLRRLAFITPLKKPSNFNDENIRIYISNNCQGTIGGIVDVIRKGAEVAINSGREFIDYGILKKMDYSPPIDSWEKPSIADI